jgi:hypothetical protein
VAVAESGREGEVRYLGEIEAAPAAVERLLRKLACKYKTLHVCAMRPARPGMGSIARSEPSATPVT